MKKSLKISSIIIALAFGIMLLGITKVNAATPISFENTGNYGVSLTELDLGSTVYGGVAPKSFRIRNTTGNEITISNVAIDTTKFRIGIEPATTIAPNGNTIIQFISVRELSVADSPVTATLTITVDGTTDVTIPVKVTIDKADPADPSYVKEAAIGDKISSVNITGGWVWADPDVSISAGDNNYPITYTDTTGNYKSLTKNITITGLTAYTVTLPTDPNVWSPSASQFRVLEDFSVDVVINAKNGRFITSLTVNGDEQLTTKTDTFNLKIDKVKENIVIKTISERTVIEPMKDPVTNKIIIPKHIKGNEGSIELKFDYNFNNFGINSFKVDGNELSNEDIMKYFKFREGSVIIEMTNEYLETLATGTHTLEIIASAGELFKGSFVVEEPTSQEKPTVSEPTVSEPTINNPNTSDNIVIYSALALVSLIGITVIFYKIKK